MTWKEILKIDFDGLKRSYPSLKDLPDDAIREFDRRLSPTMNANRLIDELKQKYGVRQRAAIGRFTKEDISKKDKKDMRVGRVYTSDRPGKKIMMLTHEGKKIHAGAKGYGNYKGKGKNRGGGTHTNKKRRSNFKARHNCDQCKGRITTPKCLACKKLW